MSDLHLFIFICTYFVTNFTIYMLQDITKLADIVQFFVINWTYISNNFNFA